MPEVKISALPAATALDGTEKFPVVQGGVTKTALTGTFARLVLSIAALRTVTGGAGQQARLPGYYNSGDGGGGTFYWDAASTAADNGGTIIAVTGVTAGRWRRIVEGDYSVKWFGAKGDNATDDTAAVQATIDRADTVLAPLGRYVCGALTVSRPGIEIKGEGPGDGGETAYGTSLKCTTLTVAGAADWFTLSAMHFEGTLNVGATGPNVFMRWSQVLFRNPIPYAWNVDIAVSSTLNTLQGLHAEDCMFDQGGVRINAVNTSLFERCRFANSRKDAALYLNQDAAFTGSENQVTLDTCTVEGNEKRGVYLGRNTGRVTIKDTYFEQNNIGTPAGGFGDIEIASLDTINDGGLVLDGNIHVGTSSEYAVKFPAAPTRQPRMVMQFCKFNNQPASGPGAVVHNPPLGLISIGNYSATTLYTGGAGPSLRILDGGTGAGGSGQTTRDYIELRDLNLYRVAANQWKTDNRFRFGSDVILDTPGSGVQFLDGSERYRLYISGGIFYLRDILSNRMHATFSGGGTDTSANTTLHSNLAVGGALDHDGATVGFNGALPVGKRTLGAAATDLASVITLANNLRQALIDLGLGQT